MCVCPILLHVIVLLLITFSDPDQARQIAASDRSLQCLQDSDIIIIVIIIHFSEPSLDSV